MAVDLGKQYGPLPLGAWIVVVGGGLGIAYYTRRSGEGAPVEVEDGSVPSGVGTGEVGGWLPTTPGSSIEQQPITTNEQWAVRAINDLIASNYPPVAADNAIRKYIQGMSLSIAEQAMVAIALAKWGSPPQPLPPAENENPPQPPSGGGGSSTNSRPAAPTGMRVVAVGPTAVTLQWVPTPGAASNIVYQGFGGRVVGANVGPIRRYKWDGLTPGKTYYFSVASVSSSGLRSGKTSNVVRVRTPKR